jgi:hypothetical protein
MTRATLRTLLGQLLQTDLDNYAGDSPSTSDLDAQLNRALREIARFIRPKFAKVNLTITSPDQEIDLGNTTKFARAMLSVDRIYVSSGVEVQVVPMPQFERDTNWRFATSGTPILAAVENNTLRFDRPWATSPTVIVAGDGFYLPLTSDSQVPELPEDAHEAIAYVAAVFAAEPSIVDGTAMSRLQTYSQRSFAALDAVRKQLANQQFDLTHRPAISSAW